MAEGDVQSVDKLPAAPNNKSRQSNEPEPGMLRKSRNDKTKGRQNKRTGEAWSLRYLQGNHE